MVITIFSMGDGRRSKVEREMADWREASRREDDATPGSHEAAEAAEEAERHKAEFDRLTDEAREEYTDSGSQHRA
jgi:hypothetical protein